MNESTAEIPTRDTIDSKELAEWEADFALHLISLQRKLDLYLSICRKNNFPTPDCLVRGKMTSGGVWKPTDPNSLGPEDCIDHDLLDRHITTLLHSLLVGRTR